MENVRELISKLPKVELHLHIEGTLEPDLAFALAARNGIKLPFADVESLRAAYDFHDLQSFLDLYYSCCDVLQTEADFFDLTMAYLNRVHDEGVVHTEIFFDPQTHTDRGVPFEAVYSGIRAALDKAKDDWGLTSQLILCFLRHLPQSEALKTWEQAQPFLEGIAGVGLDSGEVGNPPQKFAEVFAKAREKGLHCVAHAGEEGPPSYIVEALDVLGVERIDHGVRCEEDDALVKRLVARRIPLTVCPLSNIKLCVFDDIAQHNLKRLLDKGLCVTINSDDPAYFGGYMIDNYIACAEALSLSSDELVKIASNSIEAAFVDETRRAELKALLDQCA